MVQRLASCFCCEQCRWTGIDRCRFYAPETLREHIRKCNAATKLPFGVNIPLMYPQIEEIMNIVVEEGVKIVFTSAGNPKTWTGWLKERGITVVHVFLLPVLL